MSLMYGDDGEGPVEHYEYEGFYPGSACLQIADRTRRAGASSPPKRRWPRTGSGRSTPSASTRGIRIPEKAASEKADREPGQ